MFDAFRTTAEVWLVVLLVSLLVGPVIFYLAGSWTYRRDQILDGLPPSSVTLYFKTFYPGLSGVTPDFRTFYEKRFGRRWYIVPTLMLAVTGWIACTWTVASVLVWTHVRNPAAGMLTGVSVAALTGGYLWVVADLVTRWRYRDMSPEDLWWSSWRLVLAVPLAYAIGAVLRPEVSIPIAFLLGAFPTRSVSTIARRLARRQLNLGADTDEKAESELEKLQGVDTRIAERFADEGITTIDQLAYADPVELTMRCASFAFSFVVDCASQSLAWIYLGDDLAKLRAWSLRGAQEIANLIMELDGDDESERGVAKDTLNAAARVVGVDPVAFERTLREIAEDPYTEFMSDVWGASA